MKMHRTAVLVALVWTIVAYDGGVVQPASGARVVKLKTHRFQDPWNPLPCPTNPLEFCDFYLQGFKESLPTVSLTGPLGPRDSPAVMDVTTGQVISVDSSANAEFLCPKYAAHSAGPLFYVSGQPAQLLVRNFNESRRSYYENACFLIPLRAATVYLPKSVLYLNRHDANQDSYPDARRCLVFSTGFDGYPAGSKCNSAPPAHGPPAALSAPSSSSFSAKSSSASAPSPAPAPVASSSDSSSSQSTLRLNARRRRSGRPLSRNQ